MRNHIVFKFLAIVLCAAALLGTVGSGLGIAILMSEDLYNKTADEFYQERIQTDCTEFAQSIAFRYASVHLGGCPEVMLDDYSSDFWFYNNYNAKSVGYTLMDANGNVLDSQPLEGADDAERYEFAVDGEYMYLLSVKPVSELDNQEQNPEYSGIAVDSGVQIYDAVPAEGAMVYRVNFYDAEGCEIYGLDEGAPVGFIFRSHSGKVIFRTAFSDNFMLPDTTVNGAIFCGEYGELIFNAFSSNGVGSLSYNEEGNLVYVCSVSDTEKAAESESDFVIVDGIPEEGIEVSHLTVSFADGRSDSVGSDQGIGFLSYDSEGNVIFSPYDSGYMDLPESALVTHIVFEDTDSGMVYEAACQEGVGILSQNEQGDFVFSSTVFSDWETREPAEIPEAIQAVLLETTPETATEETVPEAAEAAASEPVTDGAAAETEATETAGADAVPDGTEGETVPEAAAVAAPEEAVPEATVSESLPAIPDESYASIAESDEAISDERNVSTYGYYDSRAGEVMYAEYYFVEIPDYTVTIVLGPDAFRYESAYSMLRLVWEFRNELFLVLGISLLLFAALTVYLCCVAGRRPGTDAVRAGGVNCIPLDLYLAGTCLGITGIVCLMAETADYLLRQSILVSGILVATAGFVCALLFVCFCFAFAAQVKTPGAYWWHNSVCGRVLKLVGKVLRGLWKGCVWLKGNAPKFLGGLWRFTKKFFAKLGILLCWMFQYLKRHIGILGSWLKKGASWVGRKLARFYGLLPLTWQWMLSGLILLLLLFIAIATRSEGMLVLCLCGCVAIVLYGANSFGTLLESAKRMSKGDLETKVEDKYLIGGFKDFAGELNDLAGVAVVAAQKQLKSERMKTELITNVSHDIKTPLTSIINYVDLMQKPHTPEEQEMYLEVLSRQSQRLKKLIDDLMEMSKASTGNLPVDIIQINAAEAINQSLGEFADKLDKAQLTPVFRQPEETVIMMADGRLVWRVMSNLLSNAVKYALPGTRLYVDLMKLDGKVVISMKNISREELNVSVDELLERFVRGDTARNTEGSGLGLNIAQSLMELQKGQLQLMVDGDLFKVTLIFPGA